MIETTHGDVLAISDDDGVTLVGANHDSVAVTKDQLVAIAAAHAVLRPEPLLGRSSYRSIDAHLIAQQAEVAAARAELAALRADTRIEQMERVVDELRRDPDATIDGAIGAMTDVLVGAAQ